MNCRSTAAAAAWSLLSGASLAAAAPGDGSYSPSFSSDLGPLGAGGFDARAPLPAVFTPMLAEDGGVSGPIGASGGALPAPLGARGDTEDLTGSIEDLFGLAAAGPHEKATASQVAEGLAADVVREAHRDAEQVPEAANATNTAKSAEPIEVTELVKAVEPAKTVDPVKVAEPAKAVERSKAVKPAKAVERATTVVLAKAVKPAKAAEVSTAVVVAKGADQAKSADTAKSTESTKVMDFAKVAEPAKAVDLVKVTKPAKAVERSKALQPAKAVVRANAMVLAKAVEPAKTVEPITAEKIAKGAKGAEQVKSAETNQVAAPTKAVEPVKATEPAKATALGPPSPQRERELEAEVATLKLELQRNRRSVEAAPPMAAREAMPVASGSGHLAAQMTTTQAAPKAVVATIAAGGMAPPSARHTPAPPALPLPTPPRSSGGLGFGARTLQDDLAAVGVRTEPPSDDPEALSTLWAASAEAQDAAETSTTSGRRDGATATAGTIVEKRPGTPQGVVQEDPHPPPAPMSLLGRAFAWVEHALLWVVGGENNPPEQQAPRRGPPPHASLLISGRPRASTQDFERTAAAAKEDGLRSVALADTFAGLEREDEEGEVRNRQVDEALRVYAETPVKPQPASQEEQYNREGAHVSGFWSDLEREDSDMQDSLSHGDGLSEYERLLSAQESKVTQAVIQFDNSESKLAHAGHLRHKKIGDHPLGEKALSGPWETLVKGDIEAIDRIHRNRALIMLQKLRPEAVKSS